MTSGLLHDAFAHHVWASLRLFDTCRALSVEQLATAVPGTYGSILDTMRHLVGADAWYLHRMSGERYPTIDEDQMDLPELQEAMELNGTRWSELLATDIHPDTMIITHRDDGSETHAPMGIRLAQALHHGTDHRSQVCTGLTAMGIEPPGIDLWDFGAETERTTEVPPTS